MMATRGTCLEFAVSAFSTNPVHSLGQHDCKALGCCSGVRRICSPALEAARLSTHEQRQRRQTAPDGDWYAPSIPAVACRDGMRTNDVEVVQQPEHGAVVVDEEVRHRRAPLVDAQVRAGSAWCLAVTPFAVQVQHLAATVQQMMHTYTTVEQGCRECKSIWQRCICLYSVAHGLTTGGPLADVPCPKLNHLAEQRLKSTCQGELCSVMQHVLRVERRGCVRWPSNNSMSCQGFRLCTSKHVCHPVRASAGLITPS